MAIPSVTSLANTKSPHIGAMMTHLMIARKTLRPEVTPLLATPSIASMAGMIVLVLSSVASLSAQEVDWTDLHQLTVEGQGWAGDDLAHPFDRLPATAKDTVRPAVWGLSQHSAGICARFVTDAPEIHAEWKLTSSRLAMPHMAATGVSGLDLYVLVPGKDKKSEGQWKWLASGQPRAQSNKTKLVSGLTSEPREYLLYLPLYNGVTEVRVGVPSSHSLKAAPSRPATHQRPIVFYGTSITQGGCASRPGMVHTSILGRWLHRPVINLGFSGNGKMEAEVLKYMGQLDAAVFVIDCLPNMSATEVSKRTVPMVRYLREKHPKTPILLVEDRNYSNAFLIDSKRQRNATSQQALREAYQSLRADGVANLHYLEGDDLLGDDNEGTVDSSHPTDLGFWRQAVAFQKVLREILSH